MTHLYMLEDEQKEMLQDLVKNRIHVEMQFFSEREEHDSLDYVDLCSLLKDLGGLLQSLSVKFDEKIVAPCPLPSLVPEEEKPADPIPDPEKKEPQMHQETDFSPKRIPHVCKTCDNEAGKEGRGGGTKYTCGLSGAQFGPGLGCDAWKGKRK